MEKFDLLSGIDENTATATAAATATATQAAPGPGSQLFITGFSFSVSTVPSTVGTLQIRRNGGATILKRFILPASAVAAIIYEFKRPIRIPDNQDADIIFAGLGTGVGQVELYTVTRPTTV